MNANKSLLGALLLLTALPVWAATPRTVADCESEQPRTKPSYRLVIHEIFGVPHLGYFPHFYKAELTRNSENGIERLGSFSAKYFPPNSERSNTNQYYEGKNFKLELLTKRKARPDHRVEAVFEGRASDGTDYSEKLLCSIAKLMIF